MREPQQLSSAGPEAAFEPPLAPESFAAFEAAAAQLRASWENLEHPQEESDPADDPFAPFPAAYAEAPVSAPGMAREAAAPMIAPVAPAQPKPAPVSQAYRPPREQSLYDELPPLPRSNRSIWLIAGAAVALVAGGAWLAASHERSPSAPALAAPEQPSLAAPAAPTTPAAPTVTPTVEPIAALAEPVAAEPVAVASAAPVRETPPAPARAVAQRAVSPAAKPVPIPVAHPEPPKKKHPARAVHAARPAPEPAPSRPPAPARVSREAPKPAKGTGFVTANPY